jgi:thiol-disulfide isomerase/thioredoxin
MFAALLACALRVAPSDSSPVDAPAADLVRTIDVERLRAALDVRSAQPRLVGFFATWCRPCEAEARMLQVIAEEGRAQVLLVSLDLPADAPRVEAWRRRLGLTVPVVRLEAPELLLAAETLLPGWPRLLPTLRVVGAEGQPDARLDGAVPRPALAPWLR